MRWTGIGIEPRSNAVLVAPALQRHIEAMEPVDPVVRKLQTQRFRAMSAERKLELADELLALARELKVSSLRQLHPELSEAALQARVSVLFANVTG